jgi:hypothetical protein
MLAIFGMSIRGARAPKLLAVWGVQSLAFGVFNGVTSLVIAIGLPDRAREEGEFVDSIASFASSQPLLALGIAALLVGLLAVAAVLGRRTLGRARQQVREGLAILRTPARYLRLLFLPALGAYVLRCGSSMALLAAFGIPVTVWTVALALGARAVSGAVRITPGGLGTTQAIDVVALHAYAPADVVTAYSLADLALTAVLGASIAIVALVPTAGWRGTRTILLQRRPGHAPAGLAAQVERPGDRDVGG